MRVYLPSHSIPVLNNVVCGSSSITARGDYCIKTAAKRLITSNKWPNIGGGVGGRKTTNEGDENHKALLFCNILQKNTQNVCVL